MKSLKKLSLLDLVKKNSVPLLFLVLGLLGWMASGQPLPMLLQEVIYRLSRNLILVLSLIVPITAGMGLNFALVIGAMAGQFGLVFIKAMNMGGVGGVGMSMLIALPLAIVFGIGCGAILNRAKGKEMITGLILGFFANGLYQLVLLAGVGTIIPIKNPEIVLAAGVGLRNSMELNLINYSLDRLIPFKVIINNWPVWVPIATFMLIGLIAFAIHFLQRTKLGQNFRAVGQDKHISEVAGIHVDRTRMIAMIISTVLAAWGQIIFMQNIGKMQTYFSHEQVGLFSAAAILIGGATITKANFGNAIVGTLLFHLLFIVSPLAGKNLFGDAQIGEYFRSFIAYGVIAVAIVMYAMKKAKADKAESADSMTA